MSRTLMIVVAAVAAILLIIICVIAVWLLLAPSVEPEATAELPTLAPTLEATSPPSVDDSWDRIQAAGKMLVGTSADYPPFEYYVGDLRIDGFDIALMDEIGRRLGVQIEYRDFAFDGLGGALQLDQIDVAIAAISITPERESFVDFSNVYLVSQDAVLARSDSDIAISTPDDLAGYRVGVQRGSVFEDWLRSGLVDTGKMPEGNLFVYEKAEDALRDLQEQRLDLIMLDAQPAEVAVAVGDVKVVAQGLNMQRFAIALPKGASSLKAEIDRVLNDLNNEGIIAQLAKQYLNVDQLLPTPTPGPTSTPAPPPTCIDGLAFVEHPDGQGGADKPIQKKPGEAFTKVWRVQNTGTCTWDASYRLVYVSGNNPAAQMGGQPTAVQGQVAPGQTYDIAVDLVAPLNPGSYQAIWQMENGQGTPFGERLKVNVVVPAGPTATPAPTQTPVAGILFTVDRTNIKYGECVTFSWRVENVREVYFYGEGENWWENGVAGEGSQKECPPATITYYLRVVLLDNSVTVRQITVNVEAAPDAPFIKRFTVDPPNQITVGQCVTLQWNVEGQVNKVTIAANSNVLWDGAPTKGSYKDCPPAAGTIGYGLQATGPGGTSQAQQNINVVSPATATPVPTTAPEKPVIYSFSVTPNQITVGECVDINWSVGGGTIFARVYRGSNVVVDNAPFTGHAQDCPSPAGSYTYRVEASNPAQEVASQQQTVNVLDAGPSNPLANTSWTATVINGQSVAGALTTSFDANGGVNGFGGCNSYSASYTVNGSALSISGLTASKKVCDPATDQQEADFFAALQSAASFTMEMGLIISNGSGVAVLEYVPTGP
jgi:polar amino acid transport system substrate-binding protein